MFQNLSNLGESSQTPRHDPTENFGMSADFGKNGVSQSLAEFVV